MAVELWSAIRSDTPFNGSKAYEMDRLLIYDFIGCTHLQIFTVLDRVENSTFHCLVTSHRLAPDGQAEPLEPMQKKNSSGEY